MLSQKAKYAVRAVLYLALESDPVIGLKGGKDVSRELNTPLAFTSKILLELARANIVTSVKGPGGGFYLSQENLKKPLIRVVEATGDLTSFTTCGLGLKECSEKFPCPIHSTFKVGRNDLLSLFRNKTIAELATEIKETHLFLVR